MLRKKLARAVVMGLLGVLLVISTVAGHDEVQVKEIEELVPPSIMPVYFLSGTDYEMGYQHGEQGAPYITLLKNMIAGKYLKKELSNTPEKRDVILKGFQVYLDEYAPYLVDYLKGMAAGVTDAGYPMTYAEALMCQTEWDTAAAYSAEPDYPAIVKDLPTEECSGWAAWGDTTVDGNLVFGMSADGTWGHQANMVVFPETGNSYVADGVIGYLGIGYYMNSKGVTIGLTAQGTKRPIDTQYGLTWPLLMTHVARTANSAAEAAKMYQDIKTTRGTDFLIGDAKEGFVAEVTSAKVVIRAMGDHGEKDFIVATNHFVDPEMQKLSKQKNYGNSWGRYDMLFSYLRNNPGSVDAEFGKMMYRSRPVLRANRNVRIGEPAKLLTYTTAGSAHPYEGRGKSHFSELTYSFYEIELKETPEKVTLAAYSRAKKYLQMAHGQMTQIGYGDVRYAVLNPILSRAQEAHAIGINYKNSATISIGNDALYKWSKAMTAFTTAQALAMQVYQAFVPPLTNPW